MNLINSLPQPEHKIIAQMVASGSSVLDLGCGDGGLMALLKKERGINKLQGIEIDEQAIYRCVARGLSVFHGDIDSGLAEYEDKSFDFVILNQSMQQVKRPDSVLRESLRVGRKVIVGLPNFAYIKARYQLGLLGRAPVTRSLPFQWYDSPNLHFLSIADFNNYCKARNIVIEKKAFLTGERSVHLFPNWLALLAIMLISKSEEDRRTAGGFESQARPG
jgi:methionine biosynthesis protein MetW